MVVQAISTIRRPRQIEGSRCTEINCPIHQGLFFFGLRFQNFDFYWEIAEENEVSVYHKMFQMIWPDRVITYLQE